MSSQREDSNTSIGPLTNITNINEKGIKRRSENTSKDTSFSNPHTPIIRKSTRLNNKQLESPERSTNDKDPFILLLKKLKITIKIVQEYELVTMTDLHIYLEENGLLTSKVINLLKDSSFIDSIKSLDLSITYGTRSNSTNFPSIKNNPVECTVPLFTGFEHLISLNCANIPLIDHDLKFLINLRSLRSLSLSGTGITIKGIKYLSKHALFKKTLEKIYLCGIPSLVEDSLIHLKEFETLKTIDLFGTNISLEGLYLLPKGLESLRVSETLFKVLRDRCLYFHENIRTEEWFPKVKREILGLNDEQKNDCIDFSKEFFLGIYYENDKNIDERIECLLERIEQESSIWEII